MTAYAKGAAFERLVRDKLLAKGWLVVRVAGSRTCADLLAVNADRTFMAIQCKTSGRLDASEWNALMDQFSSLDPPEPGFYLPILAWRPKRGVVQLDRLLDRKTSGRGVKGKREPFMVL